MDQSCSTKLFLTTLYLIGVVAAFVIVMQALREREESWNEAFVSYSMFRVGLLASLSWILVFSFVVVWLSDYLVYWYVYLLFRYKQWKQNKKITP